MNLNHEQNIQIEMLLEELNLPADKINEIVLGLSMIKGAPEEEAGANSISDEEIKFKMRDETDWRKKASLAALLISKNL